MDQNNHPKVDALESMLSVMSAEEIERLGGKILTVTQETGWGKVTIVVQRGRVFKVEKTISDDP